MTGGTEPYTFGWSGEVPSADGIDDRCTGELTGTVLGSAKLSLYQWKWKTGLLPAVDADAGDTVRVALEITTTALTDASGGVAVHGYARVQGGLPPLTTGH